ncbi:hypothetical protein FF125_01025 [Aureibaculum algae]|uniref:Uncharacterized protein n=1 Tax=Aureibaculum algae TaxID=2584122 RepID=A0A5B7TQ86_9FLAO|nr:hypothetical protein [Aureibaculum algae]QCX37087.1 hypothetical protein FF125_01025 [Aureibaculum algae]
MNFSKYKANNQSNPTSAILGFLFIFLISVFLGWLYNLTYLIPIIYFNVVITIALGFAVAFSVQIAGKIFKITTRARRHYLTIFSLITVYYSHWIAFILFTTTGSIPNASEFISYFFYPNNFFLIIGEINTYGTWSFGTMEAPVNGLILTAIWLIEAIIIFFIAIRYTLLFPENPYSEKFNKWYPKLTLDYDFNSFYSEDKIITNLKEQGIDIISNAEKGLAYKHSKISIFFLKNEENQYLSIDNIFIEVRNKSKKTITPMLSPIKITNTDAQQLITKFGTKKAFYFDF